MASAGGMRRPLIGELQKGEEVVTSDYPRRLSFKSQQSFRARSLIDRQCVLGIVTLTTFAVLVLRLGISFLVLDVRVGSTDRYSQLNNYHNASAQGGQATIQRISYFANLQSRRKDDNCEGASSIPSRPHVARILARKLEQSFNNSRNCVVDAAALGIVSNPYHSSKIFFQDFQEMMCKFKIFVYPHKKDRFRHIFEAYSLPPTGNYASEHYFKMALLKSSLVTSNASEADLFYMPFSIARMRRDPTIGVEGIKHFVKDYVSNISHKYPYWNRSGGADHFYVNCHSIGKTATETARHVRTNAIQVVCSSSYHIQMYFPHKDATIPQVWPRTDFPRRASSVKQRTTLAFFAGAGNSPVRAEVAKHWSNDTEIKVYTHRIRTPYDEALLTSKYCLHVKGFEVNTARLADAMHYGCVPIIIADYHDLPFNDVLDWSQFALVVTTEDIPRLKEIVKGVHYKRYVDMHKNVMQIRQHFQWHANPQPFDAFYMVMYELWLRRHVVRFSML